MANKLRPKFGVMFPAIDERHWHTVLADDPRDAAKRAAGYLCDAHPEHLFGFHRERVALVRPHGTDSTETVFVRIILERAFEAVA